jgi:hypothetical protein
MTVLCGSRGAAMCGVYRLRRATGGTGRRNRLARAGGCSVRSRLCSPRGPQRLARRPGALRRRPRATSAPGPRTPGSGFRGQLQTTVAFVQYTAARQVPGRPAPAVPRNFWGRLADNAAMLVPEYCPEDFYAALWVGALLRAGGAQIDAFPAGLDEFVLEFFARFRPSAKA